MPLRWKNGKLVEDPYREHLTRRELLLIRFLCVIMAMLTTAATPTAWSYPKQIWADWVPVGAVIFLALLFWTAGIWLWRNGPRLLEPVEVPKPPPLRATPIIRDEKAELKTDL